MATKTVDYAQLGKDILEKVGGESNVAQVLHCATRLRFNLKDNALADKEAITRMPGVVTVVEGAGQFQVVIGNNVPKAFAGLPASLRDNENGSAVSGGSWLNKAIDILSSLFQPILGPLCAVGILKGLLLLAVAAKWIANTSPTYQILYAAADSFFLFLPFFLAVTSARKFNVNPMTAMAIAASLLYTNLATITMPVAGKAAKTSLLAWAQGGGHVTFLGIPVSMQSYTSTVIPIVLAVWLASYVEKLGNRIFHDSVRNFFTPLLVLITIVPITLIAIGPAGVWVGKALAAGLLSVYNFAPWLAGIILGGLWQVLVIFGAHWGLAPVFINNLTTQGYDPLKALIFGAVLAQAGAALGVFLRVKSPIAKAAAGSAAIAGVFGITEPAIYGVNLPRKRPFIIACLSGSIAGAFAGAMHTMVYGTGAASVLTLPIGIGNVPNMPNTMPYLIASTAIGFVLGLLGTIFFGFSKADIARDRENAAKEKADAEADAALEAAQAAEAAANDASAAAQTDHGIATGTAAAVGTGAVTTAAGTLVAEDTQLLAPMTGEAIPLTSVGDPVFAGGSMGKGLGIVPSDGTVVAPVTGKVIVAMGHAFGIKTPDGVEVLVHVGIDTVSLNGAPFSDVVAKGTEVTAGDVLVHADLDAIKAAGLDTTTVLIVTNAAKFNDVDTLATGPVTAGEPALIVVR